MVAKILEEIIEELKAEGCIIDDAAGNKAEEIIRKHMNDGWIPVEWGLPTKEECDKDDSTFIVQTDNGDRFSCKYSPLSNGYDNPLWCCNVPVIAWQPLPELYLQKGREK